MHISAEQAGINSVNPTTTANIGENTANTANNEINALFASLLGSSNLGTNSQPDDILSALQQLSTQLSQQLQGSNDSSVNTDNANNTDVGNADISLENLSFSNISLEDSNQDGEFNEGDTLIATLNDESGNTQEIRIPLSADDVEILNEAIGDPVDLASSINAEFMDAFMQGFIEMLKINIVQAGQNMQQFLEKSQENTYELSV